MQHTDELDQPDELFAMRSWLDAIALATSHVGVVHINEWKVRFLGHPSRKEDGACANAAAEIKIKAL